MKSVIVGEYSLTRNGLSSCNPTIVCATVAIPEFDRVQAGHWFYYYIEGIDTDNFTVTVRVNGEDMALPTPERAIIDCIRYDTVDEGFLCESIVNYLEDKSFSGTREKLYEVADFYGVPRSTVDTWITEAYDYMSGS